MTLYDNQMLGELYTRDEFIEACIGDFLDEATAQDVYLHYLWRKPCTNKSITTKDGTTYNLFESMFQNRLRIYADRYNEYLRVENIDFDPMVTQYLERWVQGGHVEDETTTGNLTGTSGTTTTSTTHTVTDDTTHTNVEGTEHATDDRDYGSTTNTTGSQSGGTRNLHAELPQTTGEYGEGMPNELNWGYLTNQDEGDSHSSSTEEQRVTGTDNNTHDGTSNTITTSDYDGDTNVTGSVQVTGNTGSQTTGTRNTTGSTDTKERYTGRSGVRAPAELLDLARRYITRTNAFRWLCTQLDELFYLLYEEDEYAQQSETESTGI